MRKKRISAKSGSAIISRKFRLGGKIIIGVLVAMFLAVVCASVLGRPFHTPGESLQVRSQVSATPGVLKQHLTLNLKL